MSPKLPPYVIAGGRVLIGAGLLVAPGEVGKGWLGKQAEDPLIQMLMRVVGIRDLAVGLGGVLALSREGGGARNWILAGAACDAVDATVTLLARDQLEDQAVAGLLAIAAPAAVGGPIVAALLDD